MNYLNRIGSVHTHILQVIILALFIYSFFVAYNLFTFNWSLIQFPYPLEVREYAHVLSTSKILEGGNPFHIESIPIHTNVYGFLYNYSVAYLGGGDSSLVMHRFFTLAYFVISLFVILLLAYKQKTSLAIAFACCTVFLSQYASSLIIVAKPDTLGILFSTLALAVPVAWKFNRMSIISSILFSILAFYTKPYFVLCISALIIYLFLFQSKKEAFVYGVFAFILLLFSMWVVDHFFPYHHIFNIWLAGLFTQYHLSHVVMQTSVFLVGHWGHISGVWAILISLTYLLYCSRKEIYKPKVQLLPLLGKEPLLSEGKPFYFPAIYLVIVTLFVIFKMGGHTGAYMIYYYEMIMPTLLVTLVSLTYRRKEVSWVPQVVILILLAVSLHYKNVIPSNYFSMQQKRWELNIQFLNNYSNILAVHPGLSIVLDQLDRPIQNSGLNEHLRATYQKHGTFGIVRLEELKKVNEKFIHTVDQNISNKAYDVILTNKHLYPLDGMASKELIEKHYKPSAGLIFPFLLSSTHQHVILWEPKIENLK